ncbi:hypothetical protein EDM00_00450 [Ornithobacterium rhinotracheale]|uniref:acyltransferase family protein n=1 Tax=Ornithobacterium rhinotracheale TaxID=28251 RepID=UPI00129C3C9B|nr:acyltransferase family protein [Ornithobacterium rhinotracheale]MRI62469.1 hypothetical protein [Ornithobacterium rhinotracheale]
MKKRLYNIDFLKGALIILVISGHLILGKMDEMLIRTFIYSFHMPLFIGISGYLFNYEKVENLNIIKLLKKYWLRAILPWIFAVIGFYIISRISKSINFSLKSFIFSFITPYYHLWFIPGFISWILTTYILKKLKISNIYLLFISFIISSIFLAFHLKPSLYFGYGKLSSIISIVTSVLRPFFYFFFIFGFFLRKKILPNITTKHLAFIIFFFCSIIYVFYYPNPWLYALNFFSINIFSLLSLSQKNLIPRSKSIEWIGINSLGLYLWHVVPIILAQNLTINPPSINYYILAIFLELIFIFIYNYLIQFNTLRKYFLGLEKNTDK